MSGIHWAQERGIGFTQTYSIRGYMNDRMPTPPSLPPYWASRASESYAAASSTSITDPYFTWSFTLASPTPTVHSPPITAMPAMPTATDAPLGDFERVEIPPITSESGFDSYHVELVLGLIIGVAGFYLVLKFLGLEISAPGSIPSMVSSSSQTPVYIAASAVTQTQSPRFQTSPMITITNIPPRTAPLPRFQLSPILTVADSPPVPLPSRASTSTQTTPLPGFQLAPIITVADSPPVPPPSRASTITQTAPLSGLQPSPMVDIETQTDDISPPPPASKPTVGSSVETQTDTVSPPPPAPTSTIGSSVGVQTDPVPQPPRAIPPAPPPSKPTTGSFGSLIDSISNTSTQQLADLQAQLGRATAENARMRAAYVMHEQELNQLRAQTGGRGRGVVPHQQYQFGYRGDFQGGLQGGQRGGFRDPNDPRGGYGAGHQWKNRGRGS